MSSLLPPRFLFRWSFLIQKMNPLPNSTGRLLGLPACCRFPSLEELDKSPDFADLRMAWSEAGIGLSLEVRGRTRPLECAISAPRTSDGLHLWIDTRNTHTVHRATKFCQQFSLFPVGGGPNAMEPVALAQPLARSREESELADVSLIRLQSEIHKDGYWLDAWFPASVFVGFDHLQHPRLGFQYLVRDAQFGEQGFAIGKEFPYESDPSLWQTIELVEG